MINIIKSLLQRTLEDIDAGNTNISEDDAVKIIEMLQRLNSKEFSKLEAANYLGVSRATFDNYIKRGWIPKGQKRLGWKELSWNKLDLDNFLKENA